MRRILDAKCIHIVRKNAHNLSTTVHWVSGKCRGPLIIGQGTNPRAQESSVGFPASYVSLEMMMNQCYTVVLQA